MAFLVNAAGDKEAPVVTWKSENLRCFLGMIKSTLPIKYFSQKKAWMTGEILDNVLSSLNHKIRTEGRSVLLFLDNAGCHPEDLRNKYSNIKIVFLPDNTTSRLQPLDLGIIQNFKVHYRKVFLHYILTKIDSCSSASEVAKSVNVLTAIWWIAHAWNEVKAETIVKCFKTAGILTSEFDVVSTCINESDPFDDIEATLELGDLIERTVGNNSCPASEYINGDEDVPVCAEFEDETWEESFFQSLMDEDGQELPDDRDESDTEDFDLLPPPPKLRNFQEAIQSLDDVKKFLEHRKCFTAAQNTDNLMNDVTSLYSS